MAESDDALNATTRIPQRREDDRATALYPALTIICHPELERVGDCAWLETLDDGAAIDLSRLTPPFRLPRAFSKGAPIGDASVSRKPLRLRSQGDALLIEPYAQGSTVALRGAPLAGAATVARSELLDGVVLELGEHVAVLLSLLPLPAPDRFDLGLVGASPGIERVRADVLRLRDGTAPVLICGETGTGKELVARALHDSGPRKSGPFVSVNVAALPTSMAVSELFGHTRGAFTGAETDQLGLFRRAHGGTLLLDEIGEAPVDVQVALLRAVETSRVCPVGGDRDVAVDVRVIAATDADLGRAAAQGTFRPALLHRLGGYRIDVPPLRARRDDIARLLVHYLTSEHADALALTTLPMAPLLESRWMARLVRHDWPGNVRELVNVTRQLVARTGASRPLQAADLDRWLCPAVFASVPASIPASSSDAPRSRRRRIADIGEDELVRALAENRWELSATARTLRISRNSLLTRIEQSPSVRRPKDLTSAVIARSSEACNGELARMAEQLEVSEWGLELRMRELGLL